MTHKELAGKCIELLLNEHLDYPPLQTSLLQIVAHEIVWLQNQLLAAAEKEDSSQEIRKLAEKTKGKSIFRLFFC